MKNTLSFYQQTWFIILLLILFFPAGLVLMWRYTSWTLKLKAGTSFICVALLFICMTNPFITDTPPSSPSNSKQANTIIEENKKLEEPAKQYIQHTINAKTLRVDSSTVEKGVIVSIDATIKSQDEATLFAKDVVAKLSMAPVPIVKYKFTFSTSQGMPICAILKNSGGFQLQNTTNKMDTIAFE